MGTVPNQGKTKKALNRVPPVNKANNTSPLAREPPAKTGQSNQTRNPKVKIKLTEASRRKERREHKTKEPNKVKKLKRKAGIAAPVSHNRETYPSGIFVPKGEKTLLFKKLVTAESRGQIGNTPS
mgnify:CR=1 FL=1